MNPDQELENGTEQELENGTDEAAIEEEDIDAEEGSDDEGHDSEEGSSETRQETSARRSRVDRVEEAVRRAEEATRRADAAEQRLREATNTRNAEMSAAERKEKLEAMSPEDRLSFLANEAMARVDYETRKAQFTSQDLADKAEFLNKISTKPHLQTLIPTVESKLADLRKNGQNVTREVMLKFVLGERAYNAALKGPSTRQKNLGSANVNRARTSATSGRSNMNGTSRKSNDTPASRLANVTF